MMSNLACYFKQQVCDVKRLEQIDGFSQPRRRYVMAMTPRSGSSYLCSVLEATHKLGSPGEYLNENFIPSILKRIPGGSAEEYFVNVEKVKKTRNGVYGLKASWFQFEGFLNAIDDSQCLDSYRYIYLTRRNLAAQAVSLYKATATNVFHTNVTYDETSMQALDSLQYDFAKINQWYEHIVRQEQGWRDYFLNKRISPCYITYEEIDEDVGSVVKRIAYHVGVNPDKVSVPEKPSVFKKVSDSRNMEWACRFMLERSKMSVS